MRHILSIISFRRMLCTLALFMTLTVLPHVTIRLCNTCTCYINFHNKHLSQLFKGHCIFKCIHVHPTFLYIHCIYKKVTDKLYKLICVVGELHQIIHVQIVNEPCMNTCKQVFIISSGFLKQIYSSYKFIVRQCMHIAFSAWEFKTKILAVFCKYI